MCFYIYIHVIKINYIYLHLSHNPLRGALLLPFWLYSGYFLYWYATLLIWFLQLLQKSNRYKGYLVKWKSPFLPCPQATHLSAPRSPFITCIFLLVTFAFLNTQFSCCPSTPHESDNLLFTLSSFQPVVYWRDCPMLVHKICLVLSLFAWYSTSSLNLPKDALVISILLLHKNGCHG